MRIVKRLAFGLLLLIGVPILLAILGTLIPYPFVSDQAASSAFGRRILVVSNPIHTDIAIPVETDTLAALAFLAGTGPPLQHPEARWLLIGWGARSFYLETPTFADIKPGPTFRALTIDSSVMHVDVLGDISQSDPAVMAVDLSDVAYRRLLSSISSSFSRVDGRVVPIEGFALGTSDKFYEAEGLFNALLGCNTWTAHVLRSAGLRTGLWNPLPVSLTTSLGLFNDLPTAPGPEATAL